MHRLIAIAVVAATVAAPAGAATVIPRGTFTQAEAGVQHLAVAANTDAAYTLARRDCHTVARGVWRCIVTIRQHNGIKCRAHESVTASGYRFGAYGRCDRAGYVFPTPGITGHA